MPKNNFSISSQFWLHYLIQKTKNKKDLSPNVATRKIIAQYTPKKESYSEIVKKKSYSEIVKKNLYKK